MIDPDGLLMIKPQGPKSGPVADRYTWLAVCALLECQAPEPGRWLRGWHTCTCGAHSDNIPWAVRGIKTNSFLLHYVAWHREDVPQSELDKLEQFADVARGRGFDLT